MFQVAVDQRFHDELNALIQNPLQASCFLEGAKLFLSHYPDSGEEACRSVRTKIVPDTPRNRDLVIYYTVTEELLVLKSIREVAWHFPEELAGTV